MLCPLTGGDPPRPGLHAGLVLRALQRQRRGETVLRPALTRVYVGRLQTGRDLHFWLRRRGRLLRMVCVHDLLHPRRAVLSHLRPLHGRYPARADPELEAVCAARPLQRMLRRYIC